MENIEADFGNAQIIFYFEHDGGYKQRADSMFFEILPLGTKLIPTITTCLDPEDTEDHEKGYPWEEYHLIKEKKKNNPDDDPYWYLNR